MAERNKSQHIETLNFFRNREATLLAAAVEWKLSHFSTAKGGIAPCNNCSSGSALSFHTRTMQLSQKGNALGSQQLNTHGTNTFAQRVAFAFRQYG